MNTEQTDRERILLAARDRVFSQGFSKVTVDEIAGDVGMSKKTIYKFFPSKEDILRGIISFMTGGVERRIEAIVSSDRPFEEKLAGVLHEIGQVIRRINPVLFDDLRRNAPSLWTLLESYRRERIFPKIKRLMMQAKEEGILRPDVNVDLFFLMFLNVAQGIMNPQTLSEQSFSADEAFRGILRTLFLGAMSADAGDRYRNVEKILAAKST